MTTIIGIMDEDNWCARTDNLVRVDPVVSELKWIPRDLWCECMRDRINLAYARGGIGLLLEALTEHGHPADYAVVVRRSATEALLESIDVTIPVKNRQEYWYPRYPDLSVEQAKRRVVFEPPTERLRGARVHEWVGARKPVHGGGSDLHRIARQQLLLRSLLEEGFDCSSVLNEPDRIKISDERAIMEIAQVRSTWRFSTFDRVRAETIDGKMVLVSAESTHMKRN